MNDRFAAAELPAYYGYFEQSWEQSYMRIKGIECGLLSSPVNHARYVLPFYPHSAASFNDVLRSYGTNLLTPPKEQTSGGEKGIKFMMELTPTVYFCATALSLVGIL